MGRRPAPIDIEHTKTLSQFRADQCFDPTAERLAGPRTVTGGRNATIRHRDGLAHV
jgi:hypothetical protein